MMEMMLDVVISRTSELKVIDTKTGISFKYKQYSLWFFCLH